MGCTDCSIWKQQYDKLDDAHKALSTELADTRQDLKEKEDRIVELKGILSDIKHKVEELEWLVK